MRHFFFRETSTRIEAQGGALLCLKTNSTRIEAQGGAQLCFKTKSTCIEPEANLHASRHEADAVLFQNKIYTRRGTMRGTVLFDIPGAYAKCDNPIILLSIYPPASAFPDGLPREVGPDGFPGSPAGGKQTKTKTNHGVFCIVHAFR